MAITLVGSAHHSYPGGDFSTANGNAWTAGAGNLLVAVISWSASAVGTGRTPQSTGETWVKFSEIVYVTPHVVGQIWYCLSALSTASLTRILNEGYALDTGWQILEFSGATTWARTSTEHAEATIASGTAFNSGNITTAGADTSLLIGFAANENADFAYNPAAGWTLGYNEPAHIDYSSYKIVTAKGTYAYSGTMGSNDKSIAMIAAFYDSAAAVTIPPSRSIYYIS